MSSRCLLASLALLGALGLVASPALACERHQNHQASIAEATSVAPPSVLTSPAPAVESTVLIAPAAAAAMSVTEALSSEPADMRCSRMRKLDQALTQ
jgi:hypothetical protein